MRFDLQISQLHNTTCHSDKIIEYGKERNSTWVGLDGTDFLQSILQQLLRKQVRLREGNMKDQGNNCFPRCPIFQSVERHKAFYM